VISLDAAVPAVRLAELDCEVLCANAAPEKLNVMTAEMHNALFMLTS
jgi:hypothetical protein